MKRSTLFKSLIASVLLFTAATVATPATASASTTYTNPNANSNVVFYIPHQDDEALTFGVSIMNHIQGGHNVHIVLLTDGSASIVRQKLNMTTTEFTAARNREFSRSLQIMGVKDANVSYRNIKDGTMTVAQMESIVKEYERKYPNAKHKAFSWTDPHNDHKNSGIALKNLEKQGIVSDARYYVKQQDNPPGLSLISMRTKPEYASIFSAVASVYKTENLALGMYGIGYKSVKESFDSFEVNAISRYHK